MKNLNNEIQVEQCTSEEWDQEEYEKDKYYEEEYDKEYAETVEMIDNNTDAPWDALDTLGTFFVIGMVVLVMLMFWKLVKKAFEAIGAFADRELQDAAVQKAEFKAHLDAEFPKDEPIVAVTKEVVPAVKLVVASTPLGFTVQLGTVTEAATKLGCRKQLLRITSGLVNRLHL